MGRLTRSPIQEFPLSAYKQSSILQRLCAFKTPRRVSLQGRRSLCLGPSVFGDFLQSSIRGELHLILCQHWKTLLRVLPLCCCCCCRRRWGCCRQLRAFLLGVIDRLFGTSNDSIDLSHANDHGVVLNVPGHIEGKFRMLNDHGGVDIEVLDAVWNSTCSSFEGSRFLKKCPPMSW